MCSTNPAYKMDHRLFSRCRSDSGGAFPDTEKPPVPFRETGGFSAGHSTAPLFSTGLLFCMLRTGSFSLWKDALKPFQKPQPSGEDSGEILAVIQPLRLHPLGIKLFFLLISQIFRNIKTKRDHIQPSLFGRHPFTQFRTDALSFLFSDFIINFYGLSANHLII